MTTFQTSETMTLHEAVFFQAEVISQQGTVYGWKIVKNSCCTLDYSVPQQPELLERPPYEPYPR